MDKDKIIQELLKKRNNNIGNKLDKGLEDLDNSKIQTFELTVPTDLCVYWLSRVKERVKNIYHVTKTFNCVYNLVTITITTNKYLM